MSVLTLIPKTKVPDNTAANPAVVRLLTYLLAEAQAGQIQMLAVGYIDKEETAGTAYVGAVKHLNLLGVATKLQHRIAGDIN